jgi:beta-N-acetylglucosaminidase
MYDRMKAPDLFTQIVELEDKNAGLIAELNSINEQINSSKKSRKAASRAVSEYVNPSDYLVNQIKSGIKTIELDRLITETGISKREINRMIKDGDLKVTPRDKNKVRLSSVAEWLEIPIPISTKEEVIETILSD